MSFSIFLMVSIWLHFAKGRDPHKLAQAKGGFLVDTLGQKLDPEHGQELRQFRGSLPVSLLLFPSKLGK